MRATGWVRRISGVGLTLSPGLTGVCGYAQRGGGDALGDGPWVYTTYERGTRIQAVETGRGSRSVPTATCT